MARDGDAMTRPLESLSIGLQPVGRNYSALAGGRNINHQLTKEFEWNPL
jgi:hypothetical protein